MKSVGFELTGLSLALMAFLMYSANLALFDAERLARLRNQLYGVALLGIVFGLMLFSTILFPEAGLMIFAQVGPRGAMVGIVASLGLGAGAIAILRSAELRQQFVVIRQVFRGGVSSLDSAEKPLIIERFHHGAAIFLLADAVEADGIKPLEDVAILAVHRRAPMLLEETLDFFESGDDPFLAWGPARFLLRLGLDAKLFKQCVVLIGKALSHARTPA